MRGSGEIQVQRASQAFRHLCYTQLDLYMRLGIAVATNSSECNISQKWCIADTCHPVASDTTLTLSRYLILNNLVNIVTQVMMMVKAQIHICVLVAGRGTGLVVTIEC